ncbi:fibronectin type III domain-containing protein [Geomesophilobacter sediminis]|uniref:Fibronectin type III domain-containing protein n=1 Tax=Geomesophilobacter sediminis TaxID=2798584 RepID=A0A8J7S8D6_9BACT|nr:fibronectin type III domain-containing protein [Geomesophilobacter sediminis]MBJ6727507.1 fibronectin type III domain-containing protein [Geomesophilobacter sediminis]
MPYHPQLDITQVNVRVMPHLELGYFVVNLADALEVHPKYQDEGTIPYPLLKPPELRQIGLNHIAATKAAEGGDRGKISERDALRPITELHPVAIIRWAVIRSVVENDPSLLEGLGLPPKKKGLRSSAVTTELYAPQNPSAKNGKPGCVLITTNKVPKSHIYQVGVCKGDPSVDANWWLVGPYDHCRNMEVSGLDSGTLYFFRVMCIAGNLQSPWSAIITFRAP